VLHALGGIVGVRQACAPGRTARLNSGPRQGALLSVPWTSA
jgi:hypothetical protein